MLATVKAPRVELAAATAWLSLAGASAGLLAIDRSAALLVAAGAALALIVRERDAPGWTGFFAASMLRIGDATLAAGIAWHLAEHRSSPRAAAVAAAVLALALLAAYVRTRAQALGIQAGALTQGSTVERAIWLAIVAVALFADDPMSPGPLVGGLAFAGAYSATIVCVRARRIWRGARHG
jgi:hypothetical protein